MNNIKKYIGEIKEIGKKQDIPNNYMNEILEVIEDIIQENEFMNYEMIVSELGLPDEFMKKYFENRSFQMNEDKNKLDIKDSSSPKQAKPSFSIFAIIKSLKDYEGTQLRITNFLHRKRIKLYYFILPILGFFLIEFINAIQNQRVYGGYYNYFTIPYHFLVFTNILFGLSICLGLLFVEHKQNEVTEAKSIGFREFYNVYKIIFLVLFITISLSSAFFVNSEVYRQSPDIENHHDLVGELQLSVCTKCGGDLERNSADFFSFFELTNLDYNSISIDYVEEFLPILNVRTEIRMSDWNGFFVFRVFNETLYDIYMENRNVEKFDFKTKLYITDQNLYNKFKIERSLQYVDGTYSKYIDFDQFELITKSVGLPIISPDFFYITIDAWNNIFDIPLDQVYKTKLNDEGEVYPESTDLSFIIETINQSKNQTVINNLYDNFNSFFNLTNNDGIYYIYSTDPYYYTYTSQDIQIDTYLIHALISVIVGVIFLLTIKTSKLRNQIKMKKSDQNVFRTINLHIVALSCASSIIGIVYGFLVFANQSWIYENVSRKLSNEFSFKPILLGFIINLMAQITVQLGLSEIYLRKIKRDD